MTAQLYKVTGLAGESIHGGHGTWSLPVGDQPGEWWEVTGEIVPCQNGLHLTDAANLPRWVPNGSPFAVWRVETRGELVDHGDKVAVRAARLLPHGPDGDIASTMTELHAVRIQADHDRSVARYAADTAFHTAKRRALKLKPAGSAYLAEIGRQKLPDGHPLAAKVATYRAALEPYTARMMRASQTRDRAYTRADKVHRAAVEPAETALAAALEVTS